MTVAGILIGGTAVTWTVAGIESFNGGLDPVTFQPQAVAAILATGTIDAAVRAANYLLQTPTRPGRVHPLASVILIIAITVICMALPPYLVWLQSKNLLQINFGQFALALGATQATLVQFLRRITTILFP